MLSRWGSYAARWRAASSWAPTAWMRHGSSCCAGDGQTVVEQRRELAALYRTVHALRWTHGIFNHITAKVPHPADAEAPAYLLQPFGHEYDEVYPCSLILVDQDGEVLEPSQTPRGSPATPSSFSRAAFGLHSTIHAARPDINVILHVHTVPGGAVSALGCGLLPLCQEALIVGATTGNVAVHPYGGIVLDGDSSEAVAERNALAASLGSRAKALILKGHGLVTLGATVGEALHFMFNLIHAAEVQLAALSAVGGNVDALDLIPNTGGTLHQDVFTLANSGSGGVASSQQDLAQNGLLEWKAKLRALSRSFTSSSASSPACADCDSCLCAAQPGSIGPMDPMDPMDRI